MGSSDPVVRSLTRSNPKMGYIPIEILGKMGCIVMRNLPMVWMYLLMIDESSEPVLITNDHSS